MIAEAVDAGLLLWRALWLWIIAGAAVATLGVLVAVAAVWAVCRMACRVWRAVGPRTDSLPPLADEQASGDPTEPDAPDRRTGPRWARDDHNHQEAA